MNALPQKNKDQIKKLIEIAYWATRQASDHDTAMTGLIRTQWLSELVAEAIPEDSASEHTQSRSDAMATAAYIKTLIPEFARKGAH